MAELGRREWDLEMFPKCSLPCRMQAAQDCWSQALLENLDPSLGSPKTQSAPGPSPKPHHPPPQPHPSSAEGAQPDTPLHPILLSSCLSRSHPRKDPLTILPGLLDEGLHPALTVAAFRGQGGDVIPLEGFDNVHHGLGLVGVRGDDAGEEVVAAVVTQVWCCGGVADLGNLGWSRESTGSGQGGDDLHPTATPTLPKLCSGAEGGGN